MENQNICSECGGDLVDGIIDREFTTKNKKVVIRGIECKRCKDCKTVVLSNKENAIVDALLKSSL